MDPDCTPEIKPYKEIGKAVPCPRTCNRPSFLCVRKGLTYRGIPRRNPGGIKLQSIKRQTAFTIPQPYGNDGQRAAISRLPESSRPVGLQGQMHGRSILVPQHACAHFLYRRRAFPQPATRQCVDVPMPSERHSLTPFGYLICDKLYLL